MYWESIALSELCWLVISKRGVLVLVGFVLFLQEGGLHFPLISWGSCWQELGQNIGASTTPSSLHGIFNTGVLSDCICNMVLQNTVLANWGCFVLRCEKGMRGPGWEICRTALPWCLCHENSLQLTIVIWPQSVLKQGALYNHWRRSFLLQKMLCFKLAK